MGKWKELEEKFRSGDKYVFPAYYVLWGIVAGILVGRVGEMFEWARPIICLTLTVCGAIILGYKVCHLAVLIASIKEKARA